MQALANTDERNVSVFTPKEYPYNGLYECYSQLPIEIRNTAENYPSMKLTTKGRYAVTAMLDISLHCDDRPVSLAEISERQDISLSYLEQLFSKLRKQGLVSSMRGPGGGYRLSRAPAEIAVSEIIMAVDENVDFSNCAGAGNCQKDERCLTHNLWMDLSHRIQSFLDDISLEEMMLRSEVLEVAARQDDEKVLKQA